MTDELDDEDREFIAFFKAGVLSQRFSKEEARNSLECETYKEAYEYLEKVAKW